MAESASAVPQIALSRLTCWACAVFAPIAIAHATNPTANNFFFIENSFSLVAESFLVFPDRGSALSA